MSQPTWKLVANLGDADPIEHGGLFVYIDETGVYPPEMERLTRHTGKRWEVRRVVLERCTFVDGILSDNAYHPDCEAWFADDMESVASCVGRDVNEMRDDLCSDDPLRRADAYRSIGECHGWVNLDEYPITLTEEEVRARYADEVKA